MGFLHVFSGLIAVFMSGLVLHGCGGGPVVVPTPAPLPDIPTPGPTPAPSPSPRPAPGPPTPSPRPTPAPSPAVPPCKYGDVVKCPDGHMCGGDQCCQDGTTCPSAHDTYKCSKPKGYDCTEPSGPTPPPTPAPPTPPPTPGPPTPAPAGDCADAECCKKNKQNDKDGAVCDAFYDVNYGVAVTVLAMGTWTAKPCEGTGAVGMDKACFFPTPPSKIDAALNQAFSVTNRNVPTCLYPGATKYGVIYSLGQGTKFYQWFTRDKQTKKLCGQCTDGQGMPGYGCAVIDREPLGDMSFDDFTREKNKVVSMTGKKDQCPNTQVGQYNEIDSNGLSSVDLAGIISVESGGAASRTTSPNDGQLCTFLKQAVPSMSSVPVYQFDGFDCHSSPSLKIQRYLKCDGESFNATSETEVVV